MNINVFDSLLLDPLAWESVWDAFKLAWGEPETDQNIQQESRAAE